MSTIAVLASGQGLIPLYAQENAEGKAAVPSRADGDDGESEVYRASEVIGLAVKDDDGTEVGQIKDLVINGGSREVLYAVVAMNEAEEKDVVYVMPWTVFQPAFGQGTAIQYTRLTVPQTVWQRAPFFPMAQWRQTPYTQWSPRVNDYYSQHTQVGSRSNNRRNSAEANKSAVRDDADGDSAADESRTEEPKSDKPKVDKSRSDSPKNEAPKTSEKSSDKNPGRQPADKPRPESDAKNKEKPGVKESEAPKANPSRVPTPKDVDPVEPKKPSAEPKDPKPKSPNPKQ